MPNIPTILVADAVVNPINRTEVDPSISWGGSAFNGNSGTGLFGNSEEVGVSLLGKQQVKFTAGGMVGPSNPYEGADSFQVLAPDLEVDADAGSDDGSDPSFLATIMGNLLGDGIDGEGNYLAGVIGAFSAQNVSSDYPTGALMGVVMDGVDGIDGAVVAVIDGDDPSSVTLPNAAFAVRQNNNNAGSGANYGLNLYDAGNAHYTGGPVPFSVKKADIRMSSQVCIMSGAGAPVDGTTGDNFAQKGSLYVDYTNAVMYMNTGTISAPVWEALAFES